MTYTAQGENVFLELTHEDYMQLLSLLATATAAYAKARDRARMRRSVKFVNDLNRTNPNFTPYELPDEFAKARRKR